MAAKIKKGDLVEVVRGRTSDSKKMNARNARRDAEGLEPLAAGDKGKQGRVIKVFPEDGTALVEGVNLKTRHVRPGQSGDQGGIVTSEAPISLAKPPSSIRRLASRFASGSVRTSWSAMARRRPSVFALPVVAAAVASHRVRSLTHEPAFEGKVREQGQGGTD